MKVEQNEDYGTYKIGADSVAEVSTLNSRDPTQGKNFKFTRSNSSTNPNPFQARDQNLDYGAVYESDNMSKATDVNQDYYDDYDSMYTH